MTDDDLIEQARLFYIEWRLCPNTTGSHTPIADFLIAHGCYEQRDGRGRILGLTLHDLLMRVVHHNEPLTKETLNATRTKT